MFTRIVNTVDDIVFKTKWLGTSIAAVLFATALILIFKLNDLIYLNSSVINFIGIVFQLSICGMFILSQFTITGLRHLILIDIVLGILVGTLDSPIVNMIINIDPLLLLMLILFGTAILSILVVHFYSTLYLVKKEERSNNALRYHKLLTDPHFFLQHVNPVDQLFELYEKLKRSSKLTHKTLDNIMRYNISERNAFEEFVCHGTGEGPKDLITYKQDIEKIIKADTDNKVVPHIFITAVSKFETFFPE